MLNNISLVVGLGNPGKEYINTRHNIGFLFLDYLLSQQQNSANSWKSNFKGQYIKLKILQQDMEMILLKPNTYMNLSGESVIQYMTFFKIPIDRVLVIHDELDLKFKEIRIKKGGGNAGHKGLKSISNLCGNEYYRLRIGIGRPESPYQDINQYVISQFNANEEKDLAEIFTKAGQALTDS